MFYPMRVCKKANVVVTELVTNVLEHVSEQDQEGSILLELCIDQDRLVVGVTNRATAAQYETVRARLQEITQAADPKHLLRDTIRSRRADRLKGGLGLMRLAVENRFGLAATYDQGNLMVKAEFALKGLA
jgi:anti-sigma regulatory factor (Ser/Thr protein kinase)